MHILIKVVVSHRAHFLEGFILNPYSCVQFDNTTAEFFFFRRMFEILFEDFVKTKHLQGCWVSCLEITKGKNKLFIIREGYK